MKRLLVLAFALALAAGCGTTKTQVSDEAPESAAQEVATEEAAQSEAAEVDETALFGEEWKIEDIGGTRVIDDSYATLIFLPDGGLTGRATCNRFGASYTIVGPAMTISPVGSTKMACPEALMTQERTLLHLLTTVHSFGIDASGALVLTTADAQTITARR